MASSGSYEGVMLQGYLSNGAVHWYDQSIITQGYIPATYSFVTFIVAPTGATISDILISSANSNIGEYLPQWMNIHYDTDPTTGSLLRKFLSTPQKELLYAAYMANKTKRYHIFDHWLGESSRGWFCSTELSNDEIVSISITTPVATIYPIKCSTEWEFATTVGPVYILDETSNKIYFKGLEYGSLSLVSVDNVILPLGEILKGADLYYRNVSTGVWVLLEAGSTYKLSDIGEVVTTGIDGNIELVYPSNSIDSLLESSTASINGGPPVEISRLDYWTAIDELGLVVDLYRIPAENNESYFTRLKTCYPFLGGVEEEGLKRSIGRGLGLLSLSYWNGVSTLTYVASSADSIWVHNLPQYSYVQNEFMKQQGTTYYTSKRDIDQAYIFNDNIKIDTPVVSGRLSTSEDQLVANYRYKNYTTITSGDTLLLTRTNNTLEDIYEVCSMPKILVNSINKKSYREQYLVDGSGRPTKLLLEISNSIKSNVAVTLGYTRWEKTHWFIDTEVSPEIDYIPIPMDYEEE